MDKKVLLDKGFIVTMLLTVKTNYFNESFVTLHECNTVIQELINKLDKSNSGIYITDDLDNEYFEIISDVIVINRNKDIDLNGIFERYLGCLPSNIFYELNMIMCDEKFFYDSILDAKLSNIVNSMNYSCSKCNTECSGSYANHPCERWTHDITLSKKQILKK